MISSDPQFLIISWWRRPLQLTIISWMSWQRLENTEQDQYKASATIQWLTKKPLPIYHKQFCLSEKEHIIISQHAYPTHPARPMRMVIKSGSDGWVDVKCKYQGNKPFRQWNHQFDVAMFTSAYSHLFMLNSPHFLAQSWLCCSRLPEIDTMSCSRLCDLQNLIIQLTDMYTMVVKGRCQSNVVKWRKSLHFCPLK